MNDDPKMRGKMPSHRDEPPAQPAGVPSKRLTGKSTTDGAHRSGPITSGTLDAVGYRDRTRSLRVDPVSSSPAPANSKRLSDAAGSYEVGYGRTPVHTRFQKGKSGNPKGRPRGSKNFSTILNDIMSRSLNVVVNGKPQRMSTTEALLEKLLRVALEKGDLPKATYLLSRVQENEAKAAAIASQRVSASADPELTEADLAILADHRRELLLAHLGDEADVDELMQMLGLSQDTMLQTDAIDYPSSPTDEGACP